MKDNNVIQLIERYKKHIEDGGLQNENFKWKLLAQFKGRPNLAADNFANEISSIDFGNLIYQQASSVIKQLVHLILNTPEDIFILLMAYPRKSI